MTDAELLLLGAIMQTDTTVPLTPDERALLGATPGLAPIFYRALATLAAAEQANARLRAALAACVTALAPIAARDSFAPDAPYEYHDQHAAAVAAYAAARALLAEG